MGYSRVKGYIDEDIEGIEPFDMETIAKIKTKKYEPDIDVTRKQIAGIKSEWDRRGQQDFEGINDFLQDQYNSDDISTDRRMTIYIIGFWLINKSFRDILKNDFFLFTELIFEIWESIEQKGG